MWKGIYNGDKRFPSVTQGGGKPDQGDRLIVHSLDTFLNYSENWIYPQVVNLVRFKGAVLCNRVTNHESFPIPKNRLWVPESMSSYLGQRITRRLYLFKHVWTCLGRLRVIRTIAPCLIHSHFGPRGYEDSYVARLSRLPQVVSFYGEDLFRLGRLPIWRRRYRKLFNRAAIFVVEGPHMASRLREFGCPASKIRIRPHGVDISELRFGPCSSQDGFRKILIAGRFVEKKGIPYAVEAALRVLRRLPQSKLTVVGNAPNGNTIAKQIEYRVRNMIETSGMQDRITLRPFVPLDEFLRLATDHDVFIQASVHSDDGDCEGGSPVILHQLAAYGMAFVATRHCDIPEIVHDGVNGFLVSEKNVEEIENAVIKILTVPEMQQRFARESRRIVEEKFSLGRTIEILEEIYDEVLKSARENPSAVIRC